LTHPVNVSLVDALKETAFLMELSGENPFKSRAFLNAARSIEALEEPAEEVLRSGKLARIKGVGKGILGAVSDFLETSSIPAAEEMRTRIPPVAFDMLALPTLGPAKVRTLLDHLDVEDLNDLEAACIENRLMELKGFGTRTQNQILKGIRFLRKNQGFHWLGAVLDEARNLEEAVNRIGAIRTASLAGSVRRRSPVVSDLNMVISAENAGDAARPVCRLLEHTHAEVESVENHRIAGRLESGIPFEFLLVRPEVFPAAVLHATGAAAHIQGVRSQATHCGLTLEAGGLFRAGALLDLENEAALYEALDLPWIPPELREGRGEVEAAVQGTLPCLLEETDIRGCFHVHSTYSDGANSLEEIARYGAQIGLAYIGMADHSRSAAYAGGLSTEALENQGREIDALNRKGVGARLLKGIESDILADGSLDYPDAVLGGLDFVIGSIHSGLTMDRETATARIMKALKNPHLTILGHPTGRLLLSREGYPLDWEKVFALAASGNKVIEINAHPARLDLDWKRVREAVEKGVKVAVNPDAHDLEGFGNLEYGVSVARKGWAAAGDVVNTLEEPLDAI